MPHKNNNHNTAQRSPLTAHSKIAVLGASGLVGGAILRKLIEKGYKNIIGTYNKTNPLTALSSPPTAHSSQITFIQVDLTNQNAAETFFAEHRPEFVFLAAAKVGGILANNTYKADFIYENLSIAANVIHGAYKFGVKKLLNLGSSCIYPKFAPQPMKEEYLLTGPLEPTNEPYAIAKISAIKLCRYYNEQYGTNFISAMPTNLYGPGDNFNLETSHVLPALIRKFHLAKLLERGDLEGIKKDFQKHPIGFGLDNKTDFEDKQSLLGTLAQLGITPLKNCDTSIAPPSTSHSPDSQVTCHVSRITSHKSQVTNHQSQVTIFDSRTSIPDSRFPSIDSRFPIPEHLQTPVTLTLWGSGEVYREFLYVDDLADACVFLMEKVDAPHLSPLTSPDFFVNVGTGKDIKIKDLAVMIKDIVGFKGEIKHDLTKPDGTPKKLLDVSKIKQLGWEAKVGLKEGIKKTYEWYLS